jgi:iron complex outermembrane receptor protein
VLQNGLNGEGYGIEIAADWRPLDWWRLQSNYTYITLCFHGNTEDSLPKDAVPQHQVSLRSSLDLPGNIEFDVWFRYADSIPGIGIDSYTTLDVRLGWKPTEQLEFSLVGQNLLETQHLEFIPFDFPVLPTEVERSYYGKITWRF